MNHMQTQRTQLKVQNTWRPAGKTHANLMQKVGPNILHLGAGYFKCYDGKQTRWVGGDLDLASDRPALSQNELQSMRGLKIKGIPQLAEFLGSSQWWLVESGINMVLLSSCCSFPDVMCSSVQNTQQAFGWLKIPLYHFKGCFAAAPREVCSISSGWRSWEVAASKTFLLLYMQCTHCRKNIFLRSFYTFLCGVLTLVNFSFMENWRWWVGVGQRHHLSPDHSSFMLTLIMVFFTGTIEQRAGHSWRKLIAVCLLCVIWLETKLQVYVLATIDNNWTFISLMPQS